MNYQLGIFDHRHLRQHETAVDKVNKGKGRIVNARFASMCSHYLFDPDFCNRASGWGKAKGVVEKNVQDSRSRIWLDAQSRQFGSFAPRWPGQTPPGRTVRIVVHAPAAGVVSPA
jgi:hypothetical protein